MPPFTKTKLAKAIADGQLHFRQSLTLAAGAIASTQALAVDNNISAVNGYTTVSSNGNTHTVTNDFVKNGTPVNVFNDFVVGDAHTVNLIVPTDADKLVNVVRDSSPEIHGILNSYQDGTLGGNVVFASSQGFLVGPNGVVNVGSLEIRTPSQADIDEWVNAGFDLASGAASDALTPLEKLEAGQYTVSASGLISIQGKITAASGVTLAADQVIVADGGQVIVGNSAVANYVDLSAVNVGDLSAPTALIHDNGVFQIVAEGQSGDGVDIAGDIYADGGIVISSDEVTVQSTAMLDTRDADNGTSGQVHFANVANLDLSGDVRADSLTISASNSVALGGDIEAIARTITKDDEGVVISTVVENGDITINAPTVTVDNTGADVLIANQGDTEIASATASDQVIVGNLKVEGELDVTADAIVVTANNAVRTHDVALHTSDLTLSGSLSAYTESFGDVQGSSSISEYGSVHLDGDAQYDFLSRITAGLVKVSTTNDIYLSDSAANATGAGATSSDLVWSDGAGFNFGFDLSLNAANIVGTSGATLSGSNFEFVATNDLSLAGQTTATASIALDAATLGIDFSKFSAAALSLTTSNAMIFADDASEAAYVAALANDFKLIGSLDFDGDLTLSASAITLTEGNSLTADNITLDSAANVLDGSVIADGGDSDATTFGRITLKESADYADLTNLQFDELALVSSQNIIFSNDANASEVNSASASDMVWVDTNDFSIAGDLFIEASTLSVAGSTSLTAYNLELDATTFDIEGSITAVENAVAGTVTLKNGVDSTLDFAKVSASSMTLSGGTFTLGSDKTFAGSLYFDYDNLTIDTGVTVTAYDVDIQADSKATVKGSVIAEGNGGVGGTITINAPEIDLASGSVLDARVKGQTNLVNAGDITLTANSNNEVGFAKADSDTLINLSGTVYAGDFSAIATSKAASSYYSNIGGTIAIKSVAQYLGIDFAYMESDADAELYVNSGANIQTAGNVTLRTESHAMTEAMSVAALGDVTSISMAGIYGVSDATSTSKVYSGATISAGGDLSVTAHNEAYNASSAFVLNAEKANNAVLAAAYGEANIDSTAVVESGATIFGDSVSVLAENLNRFYIGATAMGLKDTRFGMAVAIADIDTNATAEMGADIGASDNKAGDVLVGAFDRTVEQRVHSGVTVGSSLLMRTIGSQAVNALTTAQNGTTSKLRKYNSSGQSPEEVKFKGGLSFSLNLSDHEAYAFIGANDSAPTDGPQIYSDGDVVVLSSTALGTDNDAVAGGSDRGAVGGDQGGYRTSAETAIASPSKNTNGGNQTPRSETSLALSLNLAINDSDAVAEIGKNTRIEAANVAVLAEQTLPIVSTYDRWESFGDIVSKFNAMGGIQNNILTTFANSGASADKEAYGGTLNIAVNDMDTKAWIADGAYIKTTGTGDWSVSHEVKANSAAPGLFSDFEAFKDITYSYSLTGNVEVQAYNLIESAHVAGNIGSLGLLPNGNGTNEEGKAVGVGINYIQETGSVVAGIGEVTIDAVGDVNVTAETDERHFVITPSSGMGKGFGFNGAVAILNSETLTHASLSNAAHVVADDLSVIADHQMGNWAAAGAVNWSDNSSVGVSVGVNLTQGDTKAFIGDNSSEYDRVSFKANSQPTPSSPSTPTPSEASITARNVVVRAKSSGTNGALAVAGALVTEPSDEPGLGDKFENSFNGLSSKLAANYTEASSGSGDSSASSAASDGSNDSENSDNSGDSAAQVNDKDLSAAGSFTVAFSNLDAKALVDGATIKAHSTESVDLDLQSIANIISVSAAGSAAVTLSGAQSAPQSSTIAGAVAYQISFNDSLAWLQNSSVDDAEQVNVQALRAGELTSIGLALSLTKQAAETTNSSTVAISASGVTVRDGTSARVDDTDISAAGGSNDELNVNAYNKTDIGAGGGSLYAGGKQGFGLAITFADIGDPEDMAGYLNPDDNNALSTGYQEDVYSGKAVEAVIKGSSGDLSTIDDFDSITVSASNRSRIGIGAAGIGVTNANGATDTSINFMGSFAVGSISSETKALIQYADINNAGAVAVDASGDENSSWDSELADLTNSSVNDDFDFSGGSAIDNTNVHTTDDGESSTYSYSSEGERIIAVAGVVQAGKKNIGISYAHADVKTEKIAKILNSEVDAAGGSVGVNARDEAILYTVSIGLGVGTGSLSGVGSVAVNRVNNKVHAEIGDWDGADSGSITADTVAVTAQNDFDLINIAGAIAVATGGQEGSANAGGLAVALNLVGTDEHSTYARIANTTLNVDDDLTVKAGSGHSDDANILLGNAIAGGFSFGSSGLAFAGAIGVNNVDQKVHAGLKDVGTNRTDSATSADGGNIIVQGYDYTTSVGTAWQIAGSSNGGAIGVAVATNRVDSDVTAEILGDNSTRGSTFLKAKNVYVDAARDNWLLTIDAGVSASKQGSFAGSVGTGVIDGDVTARIADDAKVEAYNNVKVNADAKSVNLVGSGAVGVGLDTGAGAVAVSTAVEYGKTEAYIEDAEVIAKGKGSSMTVDDGDLKNANDLPDLSSAGDGDDPDSVSMGDLTTGFDTLSVATGSESASGLVVNATSQTKQRAITVGGAGGQHVALNGNVATNATHNDTKAYIDNATINNGVTNESGADVLVRSGAHEAGLAVSAGVAISGGSGGSVAGVAGFSTNTQKRGSEATISNSNVNADTLTVDANSTKVAQAVSAGVAASASADVGVGGAGSIVITEQFGATKAWLHGGTINATAVNVVADRRQEANVAAGAMGIGTTVGVGVGLAVNIIGGDSVALIGNDLDDSSDTDTTTVNADNVTVDADRLENVASYVFGAGISASTGVAAMINTTEFRGETRAAIHGLLDSSNLTTDIRDSAGSNTGTVNVDAQEVQNATQWALGIGAGASVGVGAVANVVLGRSQVYSEVVGSDVAADTLTLDATALHTSDMYSVAGAASTNGAVAVSIGVAMYGQGDATADDGTDADAEFEDSRTLANSIMAEDTASYNRHLSSDDITALETESGSTINANSGVPSTTTTTESGKSLSIDGESVTAARISGGEVDVDTLNVTAQTYQHSYQGLGAAQVSSVGIAGVIGITRSYEMSLATVDSNVDANNVSINASVDDVSDDDAAIEMKSMVVGLGGTSVVVNYMDGRSENRVVAGVNGIEGDDTGDLSVSADDSSEIRLGDVDAGKPNSATDGSINATVGAGAVGISVGYAKKDADVDAWIGETGKLVDGFDSISLSAINQGMVKSTNFALAGGLLAGVQGVVTDAHDDSNVNATISGTIGTGDSGVTVTAQSAPELYSSAYGVTVAGGASMGGSFAYAITDTVATAEVANGTIFTGDGDVTVRSETGSGEDGYETAYAAAFAASGGLIAGLAGSEARSTNNAESVAKIGDGVYIPNGDFSVYARNTGVQIADADGYFVGLVAGGYQTGLAKSFTSTRVEWGNDPIASLGRTGDLILDASSFNQNQAFTTAGGGGYYSGSAAESFSEAGDKSDSKLAAEVTIADWSSGYRSLPVEAGGVYISASNETEFFAGTDSTTVSVVGGSGATSYGTVDTNVAVDLGNNVSFEAFDFDLDAINQAYQIQSPYFGSFESSIYGAGGGALNGSAGLSNQNIKNLNAKVIVGKNAVIKISDLAWFDTEYDHQIEIDATSDFYVYDESKLEIGGAMQGAGAESDVDVNSDNIINLEQGVSIQNAVGNIGIGAYGTGSATAQANVSVWAAAGVVGGVSDVYVNVVNEVNVGSNVNINGFGEVGVYAGRGSDYFRENQLTGAVYTNVYNWTAVPIPAGNKAESDVHLTNKVTFGDGFNVGSDSHVYIEANEGSVYDYHSGVEKNPYLELFNSETTFGSSDSHVSNELTFTGSGQVTAGQYAYQSVDVTNKSNGQVTISDVLYRYATAERLDTTYSSRAELEAYIQELEDRVVALENWQDTSTVVDGVTIDEPDAETGDTSSSGTASGSSSSTSGENPYQDEIDELNSEIVLLQAVVDDLSNVSNNVVRVQDVLATAGNVNLVADSISVQGSGGTPTFTAKGDAYIDVSNRSDEHLLLDNLQITNQVGGNVFVTGGATLSSSYIDEQNSTTTGIDSGIHVNHAPEQVSSSQNYLNADVIIDGDLVNLQSGIDITVAEGDLIQQATIEAASIQLNVSGTLLLNNPSVTQAYGFSPSSLVNFTDKWKPSSANDFVSYYLSDKYQTDIDNTSISDFNNWFTGRGIRHTGDQIDYYKSSSSCKSCSYGYDEMNIYFNWGYANGDEYHGSDAVVFEMKTDSSDRGGSKWKFQPVYDKTGVLDRTATYSQVKADPAINPGTSIIGEKVVINAARLDINGTIEVGQDNKWSVNVADSFDTEVARYIKDAGLSSGDTIDIVPGQTVRLRKENPEYLTNPFASRYIYETYNFGVTVDSGASAIGLTYDVATGKLLADDIPVSGGGYVAIRARISSTGEDGNITVKDGLGNINIDNYSDTSVVLGSLSAGDDAEGIIRITDLNKSSSLSQWYVHSPGQKIKHYQTSAWDVSYDGNTSTYIGQVGSVSGSTSTVTYDVMDGQLYYIREGATVIRDFDPPGDSQEPYDGGSIDGYFGKYPNTVGDWYYERNWQTETSYYTTCSSNSSVCTNGSASNYLVHKYDYDGQSTWGVTWGLSYSKYYGDNMTAVDPYVRVAYRLDMDTHTYVKADHDVKLNFTGSANGVIDINSVGDVEFLGNVYNPNGSTSISTSNNFVIADDAAITADALNLAAKGSLGSALNPLAITTDELSATSSHGSVFVDVQGSDGDIAIGTISAKYDVNATFDKGIVAKNSSSVISGDQLTITSETGGIGSVGAIGNTATYGYMKISATGAVTLSAAKDIAVNQVSGDLALYSAEASGDIVIKLDNGHLVSAQNQYQLSDEELAYQASVWDSLHLLDANAGEVAVTSYENQFTNKYHTYWLLKQRITDDSEGSFSVDSDYSEALMRRYDVATEAEMLAAVQAEYESIQQWFADQIATPDSYASEADALGIEQKGKLEGYDYADMFTSAYDSDYVFAMDRSSDWYSNIIDGAQKTESQLTLTINAIEGDASDNSGGNAASKLTSKGTNITASGLHIITSTGRIGENLSDLSFTVSKDGSTTLTDAQKAALLSAGDGDVSFVDNGASYTLTIKQLDPIKVNTTGDVYVNAQGEIYLEAAKSIHLAEVTTADALRLYSAGDITGVAGKQNVSAVDVQLTSTGSIGDDANHLTVSSSGVMELVDADADVYIDHSGSNLIFDSLSAGGIMSLSNDQGLYANSDTSTIKADEFDFDFSGFNVGSSTRAINLTSAGTGGLSLTGNTLWLSVYGNSGFTLNDVTAAGALNLTSNTSLNLAGDVMANAINVNADAYSISSQLGSSLTASNSLWVRAASIDFGNAQLNASSGYVFANGTSLVLGDTVMTSGNLDALATSTLTVLGDVDVQSGNVLLDANVVAADQGGSLTVSGNATVNGTQQIDLSSVAMSSGELTLNGGTNGISLHNATVNTLLLNADGTPNVDVTLGNVTTNTSATVRANQILVDGVLNGGDYNLTAQNGLTQDAGLIVNDLTVSTGNGVWAVNDDVTANDVSVTNSNGVDLAANTTLAANSLTVDASSLSMASGATLDIENALDITTTGNTRLHNVDAESSVTVSADTLQSNGSLNAIGDVTLNTASSMTLSGTVHSGANLEATASGDMETQAAMSSDGHMALQSTNGAVQLNGTVAAGTNLSVSARTDIASTETLSATNDLLITSALGGIDTAKSLSAGGAITLEAMNDIIVDALMSSGLDMTMMSSDGDIQANGALISSGLLSIDASGDVTLNGDVQSALTSAISAGANIASNGVFATDDAASFDAGQMLSLNGETNIQGNLSTTSGTRTQINANTNVASNLTMEVGSELSIAEGVVVDVAGNSSLQVGSISMADNSHLQSDDTVNVTAVGDAVLHHVSSAAAIDVAAENLTLNGAMLASLDDTATVTLTSQGDLVVDGTITASGDVRLSSADALAVNGAITTDAGLTLEAVNDIITQALMASGLEMSLRSNTGYIETNGAITSLGLLDVNANGDVILNESVQVALTTAITSHSAIALNGNSELTDDVTLIADGDVSVAGTLSTQGQMSIDSGRHVALNGATDVNKGLSIVAAQQVSIADNNSLTVGAATQIDAASITMGTAASLNSQGLVELTTSGAQTLATIVGEQGLVIEGDTITLNESVTLGNDLVGADLVVNAGDVTVSDSVSVSQNAQVDAQSWTMGDLSEMQLGGDLIVTTTGAQRHNQLTVNGLAQLTSADDIRWAGDVDIAQSLVAQASGVVSLAQNKQLTVADISDVDGAAIAFESGSVANLNGVADMTSHVASITLNDVYAINGIQLSSASFVDVTGNMVVGTLDLGAVQPSAGDANLVVNAVDGVSLAQGERVAVGGYVDINAQSFVMGEGSELEANDRLHVNVDENIHVGRLTSHADATDAILLNAVAGAITSEAGAYDVATDSVNFSHLTASAQNGGAVLTAATGIGSPLVVTAPWLSAETLDGDVNLVTTQDTHATLLKTSKGNNIKVRALGDLTIDELLGTPWLYVDGHFVATDMTIDGGEIQSKQSITVETITMTESGPLSLEAPSIEANIYGQDLAELNLSLSGVEDTQAQWIKTNIYGAQKLNLSELNTYRGQLNTRHDQPWLSIDNIDVTDGTVSGGYAITTETLSVDIDNENPGSKNVDVQALTVYKGESSGDFSISVNGNEVRTNAVVSRSREPAEIYYYRAENGLGEAFDRYDGDRNLQDITQPEDVIPEPPVEPWHPSPIIPKIFGKGVDPQFNIPEVSEEDASEEEDEYGVVIAANDTAEDGSEG